MFCVLLSVYRSSFARLEDTIEALKAGTIQRATNQATSTVAGLTPMFKQDTNAYFFECAHRTRNLLDDFKLVVRDRQRKTGNDGASEKQKASKRNVGRGLERESKEFH